MCRHVCCTQLAPMAEYNRTFTEMCMKASPLKNSHHSREVDRTTIVQHYILLAECVVNVVQNVGELRSFAAGE